MIFISHNGKDKEVVAPFAHKLAEIFGIKNVFYDSWSIRPGDGIIDKMNEGLEKCKFFFFFISKNSLESEMVKLEWQNAIIKKTKGETRFIPVRLDSSLIPPILLQTLYINLYEHGLNVAIHQAVDVISGNDSTIINAQFSNLQTKISKENNTVTIEISAIHFLEPMPVFLVLTRNKESDLTFKTQGGSFWGGFNSNIKLDNGEVVNAIYIKFPDNIIPGFPQRIFITEKGDTQVQIIGVLHPVNENKYIPIPIVKN